MKRNLVFVALLVCFPSFAKAQTCDLNATTANFSSQLAAANPGQTVCLASGNYGAFAGVQKSSPGVTITAAAGATPTMNLQIRQTSPIAAWLILDHLTISGGEISGPAHDLTFQNDTFTDKLNIWASANNSACSSCGAMNNSNILFNNDLFNMAANPSGSSGYEGRLNFVLGGSPAGVTVEDSQFTSGCADGIDINSGGMGVTIGPGNEFYNLMQGTCTPHVDAIQFDGSDSPGPTITGNYFHNNSTGIVAFDFTNSAMINNNVIINTAQDFIELAGFDSSSVVEHNTVIGGSINCDVSHQGNICKAIIRNNIATGISLTCCTGSTGSGSPTFDDYNLYTTGSGPGLHSLSATPTFVGGKTPTTYAGWALTSASRGHIAATDGTDIGINVSVSNSGRPNSPSGLSVVVN